MSEVFFTNTMLTSLMPSIIEDLFSENAEATPEEIATAVRAFSVELSDAPEAACVTAESVISAFLSELETFSQAEHTPIDKKFVKQVRAILEDSELNEIFIANEQAKYPNVACSNIQNSFNNHTLERLQHRCIGVDEEYRHLGASSVEIEDAVDAFMHVFLRRYATDTLNFMGLINPEGATNNSYDLDRDLSSDPTPTNRDHHSSTTCVRELADKMVDLLEIMDGHANKTTTHGALRANERISDVLLNTKNDSAAVATQARNLQGMLSIKYDALRTQRRRIVRLVFTRISYGEALFSELAMALEDLATDFISYLRLLNNGWSDLCQTATANRAAIKLSR